MRVSSPPLLLSLIVLAGCPTRQTSDQPPSLRITSPAALTYTNGQLVIAVSAPGFPEPATVSLYLDEALIAVLSPASGYRGYWNSATTTEGTHTLVARASFLDGTVVSPPVTVVVDRTPPQVVSLTPAPGAFDVSLRAPIQAQFSEPVAPLTVTARVASLTFGTTAVVTTTSLSPDHRVVAIAIDDLESVLLPATATVSLATTITDLAGNRLVPPPTAWTWVVPAWFKLPPVMLTYSQAALAVGSDGKAVLIRDSRNATTTALGLDGFQSDDLSWTLLDANGLPSSGHNGERGFSAAVNSLNQPIVAFVDETPAGRTGPGISRITLVRWDGAAWSWLGSPNDFDGDATGTPPHSPIVSVDSTDSVTITWAEPLGTTRKDDLFVKRLTGSTWDESYQRLGKAGVTEFDAASNSAGEPFVIFRSPDAQVGVATWKDHVPAVLESGLFDVTIAFDASDRPLVVDSGRWVRSIVPVGTAAGFSEPLPTTTGTQFRLTTTADHRPVVAWLEGATTKQLALAVWNGRRWDTRAMFDGNDTNLVKRPTVLVDGRGNVWVAWNQTPPMNFDQVNVWRSNYWGTGL